MVVEIINWNNSGIAANFSRKWASLSLLDTYHKHIGKKKWVGSSSNIFFFQLIQNVTKIRKDQESKFFISLETYFCHARKFVSQILDQILELKFHSHKVSSKFEFHFHNYNKNKMEL